MSRHVPQGVAGAGRDRTHTLGVSCPVPLTRPSDGPAVCACDIELVRTEFYRQYPADGTEQQKTYHALDNLLYLIRNGTI